MRIRSPASRIIRLVTVAILLTLASVLAWLSWTAPQPGREMLLTASVPLGLALALFLGRAIAAAFADRRNARTDPPTEPPERQTSAEIPGRHLHEAKASCELPAPEARIGKATGAGGDKALRPEEMNDALRRSMGRAGDLQVHYQPICDTATGELVLAEAMMRWTSREPGRMSPARFIPIAEETRLMPDLGYRLINQVCRDLRTWPQLRVSINVASGQLREAGFIERMTAIVERHCVDPGRIEIELTEELLVENPDLAAFKLDNLREAGHRLALDDFGTGFASIGHLRKVNFDALKINRAVVDGIGISPNAEDLLRSLALLARALDLRSVAEGVEGADQAVRLEAMGFDMAQGGHFGEAVPLGELKARFADRIALLSP